MNIEPVRHFAVLDSMIKEYEAKVALLKSLRSKLGGNLYTQFVNESIKQLQIEPTITVNGREVILFADGKARVVEPDVKPKVHVKEECQEQMINWFENADAKAYAALVKKTVHPKSLESWVINRKKENKPVPEFFLVHNVETAKVTVKKGGK